MTTPSTLKPGVRAEQSFGIQESEPKWFMTFRIVERHVGTMAAIVFFPLNLPLSLLCIGSYIIRIVGADAVYHRYFAHRSFRVRRGTQFLLALIGSQSGQRGPLWWALKHREHHKHVETERDPHSPFAHSIMHSAFRWFVAPENVKTNFDAIPDFAGYRELRWLNRYYWLPFYGVGGLLFLIGALGGFGREITGWSAFLWGFEVPATLVLYVSAGINVLNHMPQIPGGYRRFETPDRSTNRLILGVISSGVGFHNNHHHHAACARCGFSWWEFDISYGFILVLRAAGLAWDVRANIPVDVVADDKVVSTPQKRT